MAKTRQQKEEIVKNLAEKLGKARSWVLADYRGLTMKQLSDLRNKLREQQAEFTITKNTLLKLALPTYDFRLPTSALEGPTATLFAYDDEISPLKILVKTLKEASLGKVKAGFFEGQFQNEKAILQLALLSSKDELYGKTVGILAAPLKGMISVLQGNLRNLVYALSQIKENRSASA